MRAASFFVVTSVLLALSSAKADLVFDAGAAANAGANKVGGFGAFIWSTDKPGLPELDSLNIKFVRTTWDGEAWSSMQTLREGCAKRGIKYVYTLWDAPASYTDGAMLKDPYGFAAYWKDQVAMLGTHNIRPDYIDLMNEPDS